MTATTYGAPGVYIEEVPSGSMPIEGVGTAVAAFVGLTQTYHPDAGDPDDPDGVQPQLVTSWDQFVRVYGGYTTKALLPHAVHGFFANGGRNAFIVRLPGGGAAPSAPQAVIRSATHPNADVLRVEGLDAASTARLEVAVEKTAAAAAAGPEGGGDPPAEFTLRVLENGTSKEEYPGLTMGRGAHSADRVVNERSARIRLVVAAALNAPATERFPADGVVKLERPTTAVATDPALTPADVVGSEAARTGYQGLAVADAVTMVSVPDLATIATSPQGAFDLDLYMTMQGQLVDWCEASRSRMAILDPPPGINATGAMQWRERLGRDSAFAAAYYPQVVVENPLATASATARERYLAVPPSGHIAGVWARTDGVRGVHKAPANEVLRGIARLETSVTTGEQDLLNPMGVNCLRAFGSSGMRIWGARTLARTDPSWRYIPVRRLFIYLEESIRRGTQWVVFEPNDRDLWERVKRTVTAFLRGVWRSGALVGATPEQAFYVRCDESNNPPESVDEGKLVVEVGVCPVKPAEFVVFRISQWQGGTTTAE
jgi:phage tail sheath protein FI